MHGFNNLCFLSQDWCCYYGYCVLALPQTDVSAQSPTWHHSQTDQLSRGRLCWLLTNCLLHLQCLFSNWFCNVRAGSVQTRSPTLPCQLTSYYLLPTEGTHGRSQGGRRGGTAPSRGEILWVFKSVYVEINWRIRNHFVSFSKYLGLLSEVANWAKNCKTESHSTKKDKHLCGIIITNVTNTYQIYSGNYDCSLLKSLWDIIHQVSHWALLIY